MKIEHDYKTRAGGKMGGRMKDKGTYVLRVTQSYKEPKNSIIEIKEKGDAYLMGTMGTNVCIACNIYSRIYKGKYINIYESPK